VRVSERVKDSESERVRGVRLVSHPPPPPKFKESKYSPPPSNVGRRNKLAFR
jgi:hypothetical protein